MSAPVLEARGLGYAYDRERPAISGLDLSVHSGSRLAVLGPNGCGKTTLFFLLVGILKPSGGVITLNGQPADYSRRGLVAWRGQVSLVMQEPDDQLFAPSVYQDVSFGPLNLGLSEAEARARVEEALAAMGIADLAERPPHLLSFGQRKRVALAGALAMRPRVLLLDEPLAGLDSAAAAQCLAKLSELNRAGTAIVFSTHDADQAYGWADEVAVLHSGRVLRQGPVAEVLADPVVRPALPEPPWVMRFAEGLQAKGLIPSGAGLPRTRAELLRLLEAAGLGAPPREPRA